MLTKKIFTATAIVAFAVCATASFAGELTDKRDGKTYKTVNINGKEWMAENLAFNLNPGSQSWCYENDESNCQKFGRLYTWAAAVGKLENKCGLGKVCKLKGKVRGICPDGWHLPSKAEYKALVDFTGDDAEAIEYLPLMLITKTGWKDFRDTEETPIEGTDDFGLSFVPSGYAYSEEGDFYFSNIGGAAYLWSSTEDDKYAATHFYMVYDNIEIESAGKENASAVRCVKD